MRWIRHRDPLGGVTPNGEPERYLRDVVMAYDGNDCLTWPYTIRSDGYAVLKRDGQRHTASRLVCEEANGPPPTPEHHAAHSCGNGQLACVTKRHLSWKTPLGNAADTVAHGRSTRGVRNSQAKLDDAKVGLILALLKDGISHAVIAKQFGVHQSTISLINSRKRWSWVSP